MEGRVNDKSRRQRVDGDVSRREFLGKPAREADNASLGRGIRDGAIAAAVAPGHRGHIDDPPAAAHVFQNLPRAVKRAGKVDVNHLMPMRVGHLINVDAADQMPGVVDQNVNAAAQIISRRCCHHLHLAAVGGVQLEHLGSASLPAHLPQGLLGFINMGIISDSDICAALTESFGDAGADADIPARYQGRSACQVDSHSESFSLILSNYICYYRTIKYSPARTFLSRDESKTSPK